MIESVVLSESLNRGSVSGTKNFWLGVVFMKWCFWLILLATGFVLPVSNLYAEDPPIELGAVNWTRDLENAKKLSAKTGKPIMVLFQEVPG